MLVRYAIDKTESEMFGLGMHGAGYTSGRVFMFPILGFAHAEECKLLDEVELILRDQLEAQQLCVFVAAVTSDGCRLYLTYSSQVAACEDIIIAIDHDWIYHSISSYAQEDCNWESLEALLQLEQQIHL